MDAEIVRLSEEIGDSNKRILALGEQASRPGIRRIAKQRLASGGGYSTGFQDSPAVRRLKNEARALEQRVVALTEERDNIRGLRFNPDYELERSMLQAGEKGIETKAVPTQPVAPARKRLPRQAVTAQQAQDIVVRDIQEKAVALRVSASQGRVAENRLYISPQSRITVAGREHLINNSEAIRQAGLVPDPQDLNYYRLPEVELPAVTERQRPPRGGGPTIRQGAAPIRNAEVPAPTPELVDTMLERQGFAPEMA
ncbi:MAG: hypothetical protein Q8Q08_08595, partial [Candidatus Omnitrophota bacterium]|nr:hypothetical protein [Candidatus Omnitrophota bacterium]MDZ4250171.1 hypothetical protein [Candidatus Nanopelagicales bacterium]